jgi:DNA-binding NarL/FixJ family response regulator
VHVNEILIADDHPLYRDALRHIVEAAFPEVVTTEVSSQAQVLQAVKDDDSFDLILLDLGIPGASNLSCLQALRDRTTLTPIIVISANVQAETIRAAFNSGATGYLPKSAPKAIITSALQLVMSGGVYIPLDAIDFSTGPEWVGQGRTKPTSRASLLTARQKRVLGLMAEGQANKQIARTLSISEITVKGHVTAILKKLGLENRVQAALAARDLLQNLDGV